MSTHTRQFDLSDQKAFASASGDFNPIHLDSAWAAVNFPGAVVVHGMHLVLWALDQHLPSLGVAFSTLEATFAKPIVLGDIVTAEADSAKGVIRLLVRGESMALLRLKSSVEPGPAQRLAAATSDRLVRPVDRSGQGDFRGLVHSVSIPAQGALGEMFPTALEVLGLPRLQGLAALSTLVGMECPGLHSLFSEFAISLSDHDQPSLSYAVTRFDAAFSRVEMRVEGFGLSGRVAAFAGQGEPPATPMGELRHLVAKGQFQDQRPLVIGASGGLGAATAQLLALGGARPVLTYSGSSNRVEEIRALIRGEGADCDLVRLDVADPQPAVKALVDMGWDGGQAYYFPSPRIFRRRIEVYDAGDLRDFVAIYVDGFYRVVRELVALRGSAPLTIFYPSSVAVDETRSDMLEYKMAKIAGELLCARLGQRYKSLNVIIERLPRIATRQTSTFVRTSAQSAHGIMSPLIGRVQGGD